MDDGRVLVAGVLLSVLGVSVAKDSVGSDVRTALPDEFPPRKISEIARDILQVWPNPNYAAAPYLQAMLQVETMSDRFFQDDAKSLVLYFLSNASSFRGPKAKALKDELKASLTWKAKGSSAKPRRAYEVWIADVDQVVQKRTRSFIGGIGVPIHLEDLPEKKITELKERWNTGDSPERAIEYVFGTTALEIVGWLGPPWGGYRRKGGPAPRKTKGSSAKEKRPSQKTARDLEKEARGLGIRMKMEGAKELLKYAKGAPMTFDEVKAAPDGTIVYVWYKDPSHRSAEQGAYVIKTTAGAGRSLDNLSSLAYEFEDGPGLEWHPPRPWTGADPYRNWGCEEGEMRLYRAVKAP